jgi:DnaD/phage-associated family protein
MKAMGFRLEKLNLDLGETPIENIFLNDFMPMGDGVCVKVYLLGFKYALEDFSSGKLSHQTIASNLNIPLSDVYRAWDFWEEKGIVKKHYLGCDLSDYDIEFLNLKRLYIEKLYKPQKSLTSSFEKPVSLDFDEVIRLSETTEINELFKKIRVLMGRYMHPPEQKQVLEWRATYGCTTDLIYRAYEIAKEKGKNANYIHSIIRNWYDQNITSLEDLENYLLENNERYRLYKQVFERLGLMSRASQIQKDYINKWMDEWKFDLELVFKACDESILRTNEPSFPYIDAILESWLEKDIKTLDDVDEYNKAHEQSQKEKKSADDAKKSNYKSSSSEVKTKLHNYKQWTDDLSSDELDDLFRDN